MGPPIRHQVAGHPVHSDHMLEKEEILLQQHNPVSNLKRASCRDREDRPSVLSDGSRAITKSKMIGGHGWTHLGNRWSSPGNLDLGVLLLAHTSQEVSGRNSSGETPGSGLHPDAQRMGRSDPLQALLKDNIGNILTSRRSTIRIRLPTESLN
ncbi:hypothetical protein SRHO_G00213990 [Serrasalmus rhombeus]